jgi:hypothetical protein
MTETSALPAGRRPAWALAVLLLVLAASAWRFYRLRNYGEFVDESAEMTTGWLLSEGETLYGSVFSHHMPLAAAIAHAVAAISPTDRPAHFRVAPWAAWALLALAAAFGPLGRRRPVAGPLAGVALAVVVSAFAPLLMGHMLLGEVFWSAAFAAAFLLVPLPLLLGEEPGRGDAVCAGLAATLAVAASPLALPPLLLSASMALLASPNRALVRTAAHSAAGGLGTCAVLGAWALRFADARGFRKEVLDFNAEIYSRFVGLVPDAVIPEMIRLWQIRLSGAARDAFRGDPDALLVPPMLAVLGLLAAVCVRRARDEGGPCVAFRSAGLVALAAALVFSLRMRDGGFHALPLHIAVAAIAVVLPWAGGFRSPRRVAVFAACMFLPVLWQSTRDPSFEFHANDRQASSGALAQAAIYAREHTAPDERIAAFPTLPIVYLEAKRRPATDAVFFLPWQAMREDRDPTLTSVCTQLRARPPRYVVLQEATIWNTFAWRDYALCIDQFLKQAYEPVNRSELNGLVLRLREPGSRSSPP